MDRYGRKYSEIRSGWFFGRNLYTFSMLSKDFGYQTENLANVGREYYDGSFYNKNGRFQKYLDKNGNIVEGTTSIFTDHFAVKGLYEYIEAFDKKEDISFASYLSDSLFNNIKDLEILKGEGVTQSFKKHSIDFMTMLVAIESKKIFGNKYLHIAKQCAQNSLYKYAKDDYKAQFEYINLDGSMSETTRLVDPGHSLEAMWFCMEAAKKIDKPEYFKRVETIIDWIIEKGYDEQYGGFFQNVDVYNKVPSNSFNLYIDTEVNWDDKIWWVQAEAMLCLAYSALHNENEKHYEYFIKMYNYIQTYFRDKEYGEWYSFCNPDGSIKCDRKGFELKGPYHVPRCLAKTIHLIDNYLK